MPLLKPEWNFSGTEVLLNWENKKEFDADHANDIYSAASPLRIHELAQRRLLKRKVTLVLARTNDRRTSSVKRQWPRVGIGSM